MVILACSSVQHCFEVATTVTGTVGERKVEEDIVDEVIVGKEVGYEKTDSLNGISSIQENRKPVGLVFLVSLVTKS